MCVGGGRLRQLAMALLTALAVPVACGTAGAAETPTLSLNGFGTLGVVHSDERQADFVAHRLVPDGAGHSGAWSAEVDSRLGLQLTANPTSRLSGVIQVIAEQRHDGSYRPFVEWANVRFEVTPALSVRIGRMVQPVFMASEYRKVGYATPWIRPPQEVYGLLPVTNFDGVDFRYRSRFAGFTHTLQGNYGRKDSTTPSGGDVRARDGMTLANTLERGGVTLFASYSRYRLTVAELAPFFDAFRQFGPEGEAIAERYDVDGTRNTLISLGARYDPGDWFVMGEWIRSDSPSFIGDGRGWYLTGGYRFGSLTPYVTLARAWVDSDTSDPGLSTAGLPPPLAAPARQLNAGLNQLLGRAAVQQKSVSLGVRWDLARNVALTVQYDHLDLAAGARGVLTNTQPGFEPGGTVDLFGLALDFVF
ncbi:porin [Billgrantia azerbaijanica]|nr:porin [Halomonas azerbaijanica]